MFAVIPNDALKLVTLLTIAALFVIVLVRGSRFGGGDDDFPNT